MYQFICSNRRVIAIKVVSDFHSSLHVCNVRFMLFPMHRCSPGRLYYVIPATAALPKPMNVPVLTRTMDHQEFYDISIPIEIELQVYDNPSLLFRIEDQSRPGEYVYQWMVDVIFNLPEITMVEYLLNLNTFIGRRVNISYAFATENGLSEYSEPAEVQVSGK